MNYPIVVLNPGGRDARRAFPNGAGVPGDAGSPPVNYHAYAACLRSTYYQRESELPRDAGVAIVLLRKRRLGRVLTAIRWLKQRGWNTLICWQEAGRLQVASALADIGRYRRFIAVCAEADGFLASTPDIVPFYHGAGCRVGGFVPTPYAVDVPAWDFSIPVGERRGIFVGTRGFGAPSRSHLLAVSVAAQLGVPATVINLEGSGAARLLRAVAPEITIVSRRVSYLDFLRLVARHRIVLQLDNSAVPGQVAGDALLCRVPCVGGDGAVDRLASPALSGHGRSSTELAKLAARLLADDGFYREQIAESQARASRLLSFAAVAAQLRARASEVVGR